MAGSSFMFCFLFILSYLTGVTSEGGLHARPTQHFSAKLAPYKIANPPVLGGSAAIRKSCHSGRAQPVSSTVQGVKRDPWFDTLTTLSEVEGESRKVGENHIILDPPPLSAGDDKLRHSLLKRRGKRFY